MTSAARPIVALDCRWLGVGGAGTVTENLLASLRMSSSSRPVDWRFWDPSRATAAHPGGPPRRAADPTRGLGQASLLDQPRSCDLVCFMHQIRPLVAGRNVTVVHDTTPLRFASRTGVLLKREFFRQIARSSAMVITVSDWSRQRIIEDLGVPHRHVTVVPNVIDTALSHRVRRLREESGPADYALYVGGLGPHKNIERLLAAFLRTDFHRDGGRLVLTGCQEPTMTRLAESLSGAAQEAVTFLRRCPQGELDRLYANARLVVQPSIEEGFGLPAREALSAGIPVVGSSGGALAEVSDQFVARFDPLSVDDMVLAIDAGARISDRFHIPEEHARAARFVRTAPRLDDYAEMFERVFLRALE